MSGSLYKFCQSCLLGKKQEMNSVLPLKYPTRKIDWINWTLENVRFLFLKKKNKLQVLYLAKILLFACNFFSDIWKLYLLVWLKLSFCLASRWVTGYTVCVWEKGRVDLLLCVPHLLTGVLLTGFKSQQSSLIITNTPIQPITVQDLKHLSFVFSFRRHARPNTLNVFQ